MPSGFFQLLDRKRRGTLYVISEDHAAKPTMIAVSPVTRHPITLLPDLSTCARRRGPYSQMNRATTAEPVASRSTLRPLDQSGD